MNAIKNNWILNYMTIMMIWYRVRCKAYLWRAPCVFFTCSSSGEGEGEASWEGKGMLMWRYCGGGVVEMDGFKWIKCR